MLFQGEERGESGPFLFFSDHIDEEIAVATREGRRREFAAFAEFAGEEVPDPQDEATFLASKLTRAGEPDRACATSTPRCCAPAPRCRPAAPRRSSSTSTRAGCAFPAGRTPSSPTSPSGTSTSRSSAPAETVLTTHHATLEPGFVVLPALLERC